MQLNYEIISPRDLTKTEKILLACKGEEFHFLRCEGVLKVRKSLPKVKTLIKIAEAMWRFDQYLEEDDTWEIDRLWREAKTIAGEEAADQLYMAWRDAHSEKLAADERQAVSEWLDGRDVPDELDAISEALGSYRPGFIKALWGETHSTDTLFLYGFQTGADAARRAVMV